MSDAQDKIIAQKGRHVAVVIAGAMIVWMGVQWLGAQMGMPGRYAFLFDLAALAALIYAMVNIYQIWRMRRNSQG